jgi:hypothetical protein
LPVTSVSGTNLKDGAEFGRLRTKVSFTRLVAVAQWKSTKQLILRSRVRTQPKKAEEIID